MASKLKLKFGRRQGEAEPRSKDKVDQLLSPVQLAEMALIPRRTPDSTPAIIDDRGRARSGSDSVTTSSTPVQSSTSQPAPSNARLKVAHDASSIGSQSDIRPLKVPQGAIRKEKGTGLEELLAVKKDVFDEGQPFPLTSPAIYRYKTTNLWVGKPKDVPVPQANRRDMEQA